jgi:small GTP-binding protein
MSQTIQKKVCMVGVFGTGKTSLVQRFVHTLFSERYLSTVGVKIDRKPLELDGTALTLVLWDLAGRDKHEDIAGSYLRGAHAVLYVADGTRRETCDQLPELRALAREAAGDVPGVLALNKCDLKDSWALAPKDEELLAREWDLVRTSAKTGDGVEEAFRRIGRATLAGREARP